MSVSLSGKFLDPLGTHPVCEPGYQNEGAQFIFLSVGLKAMWPNNSLKIHPIALFMILRELDLLHPF